MTAIWVGLACFSAGCLLGEHCGYRNGWRQRGELLRRQRDLNRTIAGAEARAKSPPENG